MKPHQPEPDWDSPPPIPPPKKTKQAEPSEGWWPDLNPSQKKAFDSTAKYVLLYGEKGSGKTISTLHALVRHCYMEKNALAMVVGLSIRTGKEGILYDLENLVLPAWRDGNRAPEWINGVKNPRGGELVDEGIGLQFTNSQQDPDTKDRVIWIGNRHGGWSKVMLVSIPYAEAVEARVKGPQPSFVVLEEITNMTSDEYFKFPAAQLGRRRDIEGPQQLYASCNPEGPSHWVYRTWFVDCVQEENGQRDPDYQVIHAPITENIDRLPPGYVDRLAKLFKDPIERQRLIDGVWVDRPSGTAIFKNFFMPELHQVGDALKGLGWKPFKSFPIVLGYDPGPVNFSIHFLQLVFCTQTARYRWYVFDELNFVGTYTPTPRVVSILLKRMDWWNEVCEHQFKYIHIGPEDAFNQQRSDGSYDALEIQKNGKGRIKLVSVPQAKQSVVARVQMTISKFLDETLIISATCGKTLQMLRSLSSKKAEAGKYEPNIGLNPVKSIYTHPFDSMSYPMYFFDLHPNMMMANSPTLITPEVYGAGRRNN